MKLLLLEQNKDKKGTLLETIVKVLLSSTTVHEIPLTFQKVTN